jgi:hypothetical protein
MSRCQSSRIVCVLLCFVASAFASCGQAYRASEAAREPESCRDASAVGACETRLANLERALEQTLGVTAEGSEPAGQVLEYSRASNERQQATSQSSAARAEESGAPGRDCTAAQDLRERICELAEAICALAAKKDAEPGLDAKCSAARASCDRAKSDFARVCPMIP